MKWSDVRDHYPSQWILIEAMEASTQGNKRVVGQLSVVDFFCGDSKEALRTYIKLHRENKERELYVVHTSRGVLDIEETVWVGIRATRGQGIGAGGDRGTAQDQSEPCASTSI